MAKRDRLQVVYDILKVLQNKPNSKPTHIMYKANLSSKMLSEYLAEVCGKGFVTESNKTYALTDKGHEFIANYKVVQEFIDLYGLNE